MIFFFLLCEMIFLLKDDGGFCLCKLFELHYIFMQIVRNCAKYFA